MKLCSLMKKEFHRFFHDPRLIVTMLLPGILIFLLYTFIGDISHSDQKRAFKVYLSGESAVVGVLEQQIVEAGDEVEWLPLDDEEAARAEIEEGEATAILSFTENFDLFGEGARAGIVYDSGSEDGTYFYSLASAVLIGVGMRFSIDVETVKADETVGAEFLSMLLPMLIVCFIFSACMSVTLESVAGEKERGTLATILVTSAKRRGIALGKILPLSCISMIGAQTHGRLARGAGGIFGLELFARSLAHDQHRTLHRGAHFHRLRAVAFGERGIGLCERAHDTLHGALTRHGIFARHRRLGICRSRARCRHCHAENLGGRAARLAVFSGRRRQSALYGAARLSHDENAFQRAHHVWKIRGGDGDG